MPRAITFRAQLARIRELAAADPEISSALETLGAALRRHGIDPREAARMLLHWYVGVGMEQGHLSEARELLAALEKRHEEVIIESGNAGSLEETDDAPAEEY